MRFRHLVFVALGLFGLGVFFRIRSHPSPVAASAQASPINAMLQIPRAPSALPLARSALDPQCLDFWRDLEGVSLEATQFATGGALPDPARCRTFPDLLTIHFENYRRECGLLVSSTVPRLEMNDLTLQSCRFALASLRAVFTVWLNRRRTLDQISDSQTLIELLFAMGIDGNTFEEQPRRQAPIVARLAEVRPELYDVKKYLVNLDLGVFFEEKGKPEGDAALERAARTIDQLEAAHPTDPDLKEVRLFVETHGFEHAALQNEAERMADQNPPSGLGYYFLAGEAFNGSHPADAGAFLRKAAAVEPTNPRFREAWGEYQRSGEVSVTINCRSTSAFNLMLGPGPMAM